LEQLEAVHCGSHYCVQRRNVAQVVVVVVRNVEQVVMRNFEQAVVMRNVEQVVEVLDRLVPYE